MSDAVELSLSGHRAVLTLNRPDKRNALSKAMWRALPERLAEAAEARLLVVTGAGGVFSAGADIAEFEQVYATPERAEAYSRAVAEGLSALAQFPRPTLARIEGPCVGGGCAIALACDLRFAAQGARFAVTPARLGLAYPHDDTRRLISAVGIAAAKDLLFTGRMIDAGTALAMGLVQRLSAPDALDAELDAYADLLLSASTETAMTMKHVIARIEAGQAEEDAEARRIFRDAFAGKDFAEGYRAFLDKRAPRFGGETD